MIAAVQKLKSKRGASIILALMFFLIAAVVGSIVLASASSNAGRLSHMRSEQQAYLTMSSAAKLLRDELSGGSFGAAVTTVTENGVSDVGGPVYTEITGTLSGKLNIWAKGIYTESFFPAQEEIKIESPLDEVYALLTMKNDYSITAELYFKESGAAQAQYKMAITIPAIVKEDFSTSTSDYERFTGQYDEEDRPIMEIVTVTTAVETLSVSWGEGSIVKGALK